ncbi:MAG: IPT/TIG domain-containing protein [Spirochaetia bacterium]|jgi:transglutaminase-like putative cysteine protease|nr:IPT/TIG domain-containing protein [Spirochaetia bacterium]
MKKLKHPAVIPLFIFIFLTVLYIVLSFLTGRNPRIDHLTPSVAFPGETILIEGENFGDSSEDGFIIIAGIRPTVSSYLEWTDTKIKLRVPNEVGSGRIYVKSNKNSSNSLLFTNKELIPVIVSGPAGPGEPYLDSILPEKGMVGERISITGLNLGSERGSSKVNFSFFSSDDSKFVACSEMDFDYIEWSDQSVSVYVPDGATSGNIQISTDRGISNSIYFEVSYPYGTKQFTQPRGYQLQYGVTVSHVIADTANSIQIWIPVIQASLSQRNVESVYEPEPLWENYKGLNRYKLENLQQWNEYDLNQTHWFERSAIETDINISSISSVYDQNRELVSYYTREDTLVPVNNATITDITKSIVGRENNPYIKAKKLYEYLIRRLDYVDFTESDTVIKSLTNRKADAFEYAILFTSLARNAGVPSRPVAGFMVYGNKQTVNHWWSEIYINGIGWIPVDPALGDDMSLSDLPVRESNSDYYFGNIGSQHITFSRGNIDLKKINPDGNIRTKERFYSFQDIYEESSRNVEDYKAVWSSLQVVDWW